MKIEKNGSRAFLRLRGGVRLARFLAGHRAAAAGLGACKGCSERRAQCRAKGDFCPFKENYLLSH